MLDVVPCKVFRLNSEPSSPSLSFDNITALQASCHRLADLLFCHLSWHVVCYVISHASYFKHSSCAWYYFICWHISAYLFCCMKLSMSWHLMLYQINSWRCSQKTCLISSDSHIYQKEDILIRNYCLLLCHC